MFFLFLCASVQGQESLTPEEMITDRPDETEAPSLVSRGFLQIETGVFYRELEENFFESEVIGYNTTLLRYGLLENLELRLGADVVKVRGSMNEVEEYGSGTGLSPLLLGAKIGIADGEGMLPEMGLLLHLRLPFTAARELRPQSTGVDFRFAFSHDLSEDSELSYNLGAEWLNDSVEVTYIYTIAYGYDLTEKLGIFAELYGDLPESDTAEHNWDGGVTYNLRNNFQLDAYIGTGINNSQELLLGAGFSYRVPQ